jgi:hypothetical protein
MNVADIISKFGGVRPLAGMLGYPVTTVQNWLTRKRIPQQRWDELLIAGREHGIDIGRDDFFPPPEFERDCSHNI